MSKKKQHARALRRLEKRAILAQMPYRPAEDWADGMVTVKPCTGLMHRWQVSFCGYDFPAVEYKERAEAHANDLKRALRRKLRHYAAQEKRALMCRLGFREKNDLVLLTGEPKPADDREGTLVAVETKRDDETPSPEYKGRMSAIDS